MPKPKAEPAKTEPVKTEPSVKVEEPDTNYGYNTCCGCGCKFCHDNEAKGYHCGSKDCRETDFVSDDESWDGW